MIHLNKSKVGPKLLYRVGKNVGKCKLVIHTDDIKNEYLAQKKKYDNGKDMIFNGALWRDEIIKAKLKVNIQKNRCCYCEKDITDGGTLEHFRPKNGWQQKAGDSITKPGYYWLAYKWENWLYSCQECNNSKGNLFPLDDPSRRAYNHTVDPFCKNEKSILLNPSLDNPDKYFKYIGLEILPKENSAARSKESIDILKLDRPGLFETRVEHASIFWTFKDAMFLNKHSDSINFGKNQTSVVEYYNNWISESSKPGSKFSFMMKCNLDRWSIKSDIIESKTTREHVFYFLIAIIIISLLVLTVIKIIIA